MDERTEERTDARTDERTDERMKERMNEQTYNHSSAIDCLLFTQPPLIGQPP